MKHMVFLLMLCTLFTLSACSSQEDLADFCTPLTEEGASATVRCAETTVTLSKDRIKDLFSMLRHAEVLTAEEDVPWEDFAYHLILDLPESSLRIGYSPTVPNAVYAQWTENGAYTGPVWLYGSALPGKMISYLPGNMNVHWDTTSSVETELTNDQQLAVTLHCLLECQATDYTPTTTSMPVSHTFELICNTDTGTRSYSYSAYLLKDDWYIESAANKVYLIPKAAVTLCAQYLDPSPELQPLTICSGDRSITIHRDNTDLNLFGLPLMPTLETTPDDLGLPFTILDSDGQPYPWYHARIYKLADASHGVSGYSARYTNEYLGDRARSLVVGQPYIVMLTVYEEVSQLFGTGGTVYYFKIIPRAV